MLLPLPLHINQLDTGRDKKWLPSYINDPLMLRDIISIFLNHINLHNLLLGSNKLIARAEPSNDEKRFKFQLNAW